MGRGWCRNIGCGIVERVYDCGRFHVTLKQLKLTGNLPGTASEVARCMGLKASNVHTTLVRLEKAGIVRSYYVKATRVFVLREKRFKRREE